MQLALGRARHGIQFSAAAPTGVFLATARAEDSPDDHRAHHHAIFYATGKRIRTTLFRNHALSWS